MEKLNPRFARIMQLLMDGIDVKDIVARLPVKKSQAYDLIKKTQKATADYLQHG